MNDTQNFQQDNNLVNETLECLTKTFSEKNNVERSKAEKRLKELESNIIQHIRTILIGLTTDVLNQELKLAVIIYLKNTLRTRLDIRSFNKEEVMGIMQTIVELMLSGSLNDQLLQNLNIALTILLSSKYITDNSSLTVSVCVYLIQFIQKEGSESSKIMQFKPVILLLQTIISSVCTNSDNICEVISKQFEALDNMIGFITPKIKSFSLKDDVPLYLTFIDLLRCILDYLFLSILKLKKLNSLDDFFCLYVNKYLPFAIETISYSNITDSNLILFTGDKEVDSGLNSMKAKAFQLISYIVQTEGNVIKNQPIIDHLSKIVNLAISSLNTVVNEKLSYLGEMSKNSNECPDNSYDILLFQIMLFLSRFLAREPIVTQFTGFVKNFVLSVLFPFLMTNKQEMILMKRDGQEYHNYSLDMQRDHKQKTYKVAASFLLLKLCERFDGLSTFLINFSLQLIDYCLNNSDQNNIVNYTILNQSLTNTFDFSTGAQKILTGLSPESQMDTSLLILLILKDFLVKSSSALAILRLVLETQSAKIFSIGSEIIKDKLCILFGNFLDELYDEDEVEGFYNHISRIFEFLFIQILNFHNNSGLAYSASFALNQLIYYKGYSDVSNNVVRKIMPQLIEKIKEIEVVLFFDVIIDIVLYLDVEDSLISLCREVASRILREIKSSRNDGKELNVYIGKCFHILRTVLEKNKMFHYDNSNNNNNKSEVEVIISPNTFAVNEFEQIIEPIVSYLKNPNKINFDDEIIYMLINLLQNAKKFTNLTKLIFPYLQMYIVKHEAMTEELFELINLIIVYDCDGFLTDVDNATSLCNMIKSSIEESEDYTTSPILGSMLAGAWLQSNGGNLIPEKIVNEIITISVREMNEIFMLFKEDFDHFINNFEVFPFTSNVTTIYSGLVYYPYTVFNVLTQYKMHNVFLESTDLMLQFNFFSTYQSKVIILGICEMLSNETLLLQGEIMSIVNRLLFFVFTFLIKQKNEESKKLKVALKKELDCNFINSEDEDEDYEDESEDDEGPIALKKLTNLSKKMKKIHKDSNSYSSKEEKQIYKLITKLKASCKEKDEYDAFNRTLHKLTAFNAEIVPQWESELNDMQRTLFRELMHTRRITVNYSGMMMDVPRRTVKIKRNEGV